MIKLPKIVITPGYPFRVSGTGKKEEEEEDDASGGMRGQTANQMFGLGNKEG